ncbi:MAG: cytidylate kinase-like family protein [Chloroflexota bacterium]|nr:cytidylate kinase-like family protein [Chloroflexota bacterium]
MTVITLNGQLGGAAREVGMEVARILEIDYVDRVLLAEAAKRVGAPVAALEEKEEEDHSLGSRLTRLIQIAFERSAYSGDGGDPFFGTGVDTLLARPYPEGESPEETPAAPSAPTRLIDDSQFFQVLRAVMTDLAEAGNVLIMGRGGNMVLKDQPGALHVGVVAPLEFRIDLTMRNNDMERADAERYVMMEERARVSFFRRHFKAHPDDPHLYHMMVNPATLGIERAAQVVARAVPS